MVELISLLVGAAIAIVTSVVAQITIDWNHRRIQRSRLRNAFITEIELMPISSLVESLEESPKPIDTIRFSELMNELLQVGTLNEAHEVLEGLQEEEQNKIDDEILNFRPYWQFREPELGLSKHVFESNVGNLGLLTSDEIRNIINYYHLVDLFTRELENADVDVPREWEKLEDLQIEDIELSDFERRMLKLYAIFLGLAKEKTLDELKS